MQPSHFYILFLCLDYFGDLEALLFSLLVWITNTLRTKVILKHGKLSKRLTVCERIGKKKKCYMVLFSFTHLLFLFSHLIVSVIQSFLFLSLCTLRINSMPFKTIIKSCLSAPVFRALQSLLRRLGEFQFVKLLFVLTCIPL